MENNQDFTRYRRFSLIGIIFKSCFYSIILISTFVAGGLFLDGNFKNYIKSTKLYKKSLKNEYISEWASKSKEFNSFNQNKITMAKKSSFRVLEDENIENIENIDVVDSEVAPRPFEIIDEIEKRRVLNKVDVIKELEEAESKLMELTNNVNPKASLDISNPSSLFKSPSEIAANTFKKVKIEDTEFNQEPFKVKKEVEVNNIAAVEYNNKIDNLNENFIKNEKVLVKEKEEILVETSPKVVKHLEDKTKQIILDKVRLANHDPGVENLIIDGITKLYQNYELDPVFLIAIMMKESSINPDAISPKGNLGLFQIHPLEANSMSKYGNFQLKKGISLLDPSYNIELAGSYIDFLNRVLKGNKEHVLAAYHMGFENFVKAARNKVRLSSELLSYREDIISIYNKWNNTTKAEVKTTEKKETSIINKDTVGNTKTTRNSVIKDPFKKALKTKVKTSPSKKISAKKKLKLPKVKLVN